jgi:cysteine-rich repeat protein
MIFNPLIICLSVLSLFCLFSCDEDLSKSNAPKISISHTQILFTEPSLENHESRFILKVTNVGTADLIISRTEIKDKNQEASASEFSLLDQNDWNDRLIIQAGEYKDLTLIWKPLDTKQDSAVLEIDSNDGLTQVEMNTLDLSLNINVSSVHPTITKEANQDVLMFSDAMYLGYQQAIIEIQANGSIPLILEEICLLNDQGNCQVTYPTSDPFFLCDSTEATLSSCRPMKQDLPILSFDESYQFSLFFHAIDQRSSLFYGKLRIKSNASNQANYLIRLKGEACIRDALQPICQKCGDGIINENEECDDANLIDLDGCGLNCKNSEIACIDGKAGCPCISQDQSCDDGLTCDSLLNLCVSCNGQIGCPCPCGPQAICNPENGLCEPQSILVVDMGDPQDLGVMDMQTMDMQTMDMQTMDMQTMDMQTMDMQTMDISIDEGFLIDMMIDIFNPKVFHPSSLLQGATQHQDHQYQLHSILSTGSSVGKTQQHILRSTLNP